MVCHVVVGTCLLFTVYSPVLALLQPVSLPVYKKSNRVLSGSSGHEVVSVKGSSDLGYYYTFIELGNPAQRYSVILDTGSAVTAVPCVGCIHHGADSCGGDYKMDEFYDRTKSSSSETVLCGDSDCPTMCSPAHKICPFTQSYVEGSSLSGDYVRDRACVGEGCSPVDTGADFVFGCAATMTKLFRTQKADGIMGLDNNGGSKEIIVGMLLKQHKLEQDVFALCFGQNGGSLQLGGFNASLHLDPERPPLWASQVTPFGNFYTLNVVHMAVHGGGAGEGELFETWYQSPYYAILDSGTTYTYLKRPQFLALRDAFTRACDGDGDGPGNCGLEVSIVDFTDTLSCWELDVGGSEKERLRRLRAFPDLRFTFQGADGVDFTLGVPSSSYLSWVGGDYYCVFIFPGVSTIFGGNIMRNLNVIFDRESHQLGFAAAQCTPSDTTEEGPWDRLYVRVPVSNDDAVDRGIAMILLLFAGGALVLQMASVVWKYIKRISAPQCVCCCSTRCCSFSRGGKFARLRSGSEAGRIGQSGAVVAQEQEVGGEEFTSVVAAPVVVGTVSREERVGTWSWPSSRRSSEVGLLASARATGNDATSSTRAGDNMASPDVESAASSGV